MTNAISAGAKPRSRNRRSVSVVYDGASTRSSRSDARQPGPPGDGDRDHREAVVARGDRRHPVRRDVGRDDVEAIQRERAHRGVAHVHVALVDRIERAAEDADAARRHEMARPASPAGASERQTASSSAGTPSPVTPEIRKHGSPRAAARASRLFTRVSSSTASILLAATICGFAASVGWKSSSSRRTVSRSSTGSRPARARDVHDVHEHLRPLEVPQELVPEAVAAVRAFDQPGHVGDDEAAVVAQADDAQVRRQRRERVVGDLRPRRRDARDERGLARVGEADQADVGEQLQLEAEILHLARLARLHLARRAIGGGRKLRVAAGRRVRRARRGRAGRRR